MIFTCFEPSRRRREDFAKTFMIWIIKWGTHHNKCIYCLLEGSDCFALYLFWIWSKFARSGREFAPSGWENLRQAAPRPVLWWAVPVWIPVLAETEQKSFYTHFNDFWDSRFKLDAYGVALAFLAVRKVDRCESTTLFEFQMGLKWV